MQFDIPPTAGTELAAAYLQAAITLGLAGLFVFLFERYRKPYFGWFAVAWLLYVVRIGAIVSFLTTQNWVWLYWHQVVTGWTGLALLWAALVFSQQLRWRPIYLVAVLFPALWSYVAIYRLDNFLLAAGPAVAFLSAASIWTGWAFFRHQRRVGSTAAGVLAAAFLLWGLHHLDYPFLRARGAWNPWGYYLDILFVLGIGASVLLLVLEDLQRGLRALSSVSGELQRRGPEHELLDALLESTATLPPVRGAAWYAVDDGVGRVVRGVGSCHGWVDGRPTPAALEAIDQVMRTGEPETVARKGYVAALPVLRDDVVAGVLVIVGDARDPFAALDRRFLAALGQQVGAALKNLNLDHQLQERTAELERLAARMVHQHEGERRRLSRELHDETAQVFSAVRLQLGLVRESADAALAPRLDRALELIDTGMQSIRNVTNSLRPALLDDVGLSRALRALAEHFAERSGLEVSVAVPDALPALSDAAELALYRALQEALANVARHAEASRVSVTVSPEDGAVMLVVEDNGLGMPDALSVEELARRGHHGLDGMRERMAALGGDLRIRPGDGHGVRLVALLPLDMENGDGG